MKPRTAARLAWSVGIFSIALMIGALVIMFVDRHVALPTNTSAAWTFSNILNALVNLAVPIFGAVLASRRPENRIGWLFLVAGATLALGAFGSAYGLHALVADPGSLPAGRAFAWESNWLGVMPIAMLAFLFLLFPTGHLRTARWKPVAWLMGAGFAVLMSTVLVLATLEWNDPFKSFSPGLIGFLLFAVPIVGSLAASLAAVVVRFRGSVGDERLQLKWFVTAASLVFATFIASFFSTSSTTPAAISVLQSLAFVFLWTAIGIAVLKYRLYEIDVVISKAVVYGTLAAFFTAVYVAIVVGIGTAIGSTHNPLLTVLAAVLIALAFNPVRERSKRFANRIVYGKRATPYEVLSEFAERMAGTYSVEDVLPRTARMLAEGTGAVRADVWLRVGEELKAEGSWPSETPSDRIPFADDASLDVPGASRVVQVRHQGELLGALSVQKPPGDPVSPTEEKLLADVASQAGLVLRNARLIEELRASRQRLVVAQDDERRRIERNIHDGAQQQLVALAVKLNLTESFVGRDEGKERAMLAELKAEATEALENLRDLARGIYPPLLADKGLGAALEGQARKSTVPVLLETDGVGRWAPEVEAAVYFCVLEALQNVAKYAEASTVTVRLSNAADTLTFEVTDDGVGFEPSRIAYGTGLQGMADRLDALGGSLEVGSAPGQGTTVAGRVPGPQTRGEAAR